MGRTKGLSLCSILGCMWSLSALTVFARYVDYPKIKDANIVTNNNYWKTNDSFVNDQQRVRRAIIENGASPQLMNSATTTNISIYIIGFTVEYVNDKKRVEHDNDGQVYILEGLPVKLRLYGQFTIGSEFGYSNDRNCKAESVQKVELTIVKPRNDGTSSIATVILNIPWKQEYPDVYLCLQLPDPEHSEKWESQGDSVKIKTTTGLLPLWIHIIFIVSLLLLSGLFSGLNLGLMSLNKTDLKILMNTGTPIEREHASKIAPVRDHGNFLLCCLLFSNVLVNATLTILVDELTSGIVAVAMSTMAIVIFGEIIPQAICSRHGLAVGAKTIYITKFFMLITCPLAWPLSKLLDKILGEELGSVYTRERLKELLNVTREYHGLETEEVGIISGTLDMKTKTVKDVMTNLDQVRRVLADVFMLPIEANLDYDIIGDIEYHGFSRIPVYEKERSNVVSVLNVKQLTLLDPGDNIPIRTVVEYYQNSLFYVFENTRLDYMFKAFREGSRGHMAFVQKVNDDGPGDPYYETIGVVTMEDVLEELLQQEIMDESDIGKIAKGTTARKERPKDPFKAKKNKSVIELPPPLVIAASQFLTTSVPPFHRDFVSENVMKRLVKMYAREAKPPKNKLHEACETLYLYEMGRPADYFILLLEGRVDVFVGKEKLNFEAGPFHQFGSDFLTMENAKESPDELLNPITEDGLPKKRTFIPDYTVKVLTDIIYIRIKYSNYRACRHATAIERRDNVSNKEPENWQDDIDKLLAADNEDLEPEIRRFEENHINPNAPESMEPIIIMNSTPPMNNRKLASDTGTDGEITKLL